MKFAVTMQAEHAEDVRTTIEVIADSPVQAKEEAERERPDFKFIRLRAIYEQSEKDEYGWNHNHPDEFHEGE